MVSALFGVLIFVVAWGTEPALILPSLPYAALTFIGIGLYSVIAVGIGTLGTDVLEPEPRRRIRPGGIYLFMMLAALFAYRLVYHLLPLLLAAGLFVAHEGRNLLRRPR